MRASIIDSFGSPASLRLRDVADPRPGRGDVLLRVAACGVCGHDVLARSGALPQTALPAVLGHEICGIVEEIGFGVTGLAPGDRVASTPRSTCGKCRFCLESRETLCIDAQFYGEARWGGYADLCVIGAGSLARVPDTVPDEHAAVAACAIGTCIHALARLAIEAGELVLVTGAGGGLGVHALQLLRSAGAEVVAVTSSPEKAAALGERADHVVLSRAQDLSSTLRRKDIVADKVLELTAGLSLGQTLRNVRAGGRICVVGNIDTAPVPLSPGLVIVRELELVGSASATRGDLDAALEALASGSVRAEIAAVLPLEEAATAHAMVEERRAFGRVILRPDLARASA